MVPVFFFPRGGEGCVFRFHFHASLSQVTESLPASWIWWMCHQGWQEGKRQSARFLRRHGRPVAISPDYMSVKYAIFQELFRAVGIFVLALSVPEIAQHNNQTVFGPPRPSGWDFARSDQCILTSIKRRFWDTLNFASSPIQSWDIVTNTFQKNLANFWRICY